MLQTPVSVGGLELKNRIVLAPLTRARSGVDQIPKVWNAEYYAQRASAGLLITEATIISPQGMGWAWAPGIYTDEHTAGWKQVNEKVHERGGKIFVQFWHMGRVTHSSYHGIQPVSASAIPATGGQALGADYQKHDYEVPRPLEEADIAALIDDYKNAAVRAKEAGFDGIEIHSANGYLLDQFLQSVSNQRTDNYGGSPENRFRLLREILTAIAEVFPINRIGVRLSPNGSFNAMGSEDNIETFSYAISELNKFGLAYLHVMDGLAFGFHNKCKVFRLFDAKKLFDGPIIGNCGYSKDTAEGALGTGSADLIAFGRPYLSNPDLVERFANNWPLADVPPYDTWYSPPYDDPTKGYTDFPAYTPASGEEK